ncbi:MAG TPA: phage baseplate assembly protein V [Burkholderiaceae bacterium]|nr:phage baseplate assembly protein V [Burkholderiaceae bacterium]
MRRGLFAHVMADAEAQRAAGLVPGLRCAEVAEITDEGYVLEWSTGTVRSRSAPARQACFMAGDKRGAYFPLEIGDEVIVGFEEGNIDCPVILGALYSDVDLPADGVDTSSSNNTRSIVSRAKSELSFDDSTGATRVLLKSAGGMELLMDDSAQTLTLKLNDNTKIELSAAGIKVVGTRIDLN